MRRKLEKTKRPSEKDVFVPADVCREAAAGFGGVSSLLL